MVDFLKVSLFFSIFISLFYFNVCNNVDNFSEELYLKPLASGHLYGYFQFSTVLENTLRNKDESRHYRLFPRSLGELIVAHNVSELHISLTQGLWRTDKWGYPIRSAPPGAELWVWFHENTPDIHSTWKNLVNALSGQFCASLNFIDTVNTISPQISFPPYGAVDHSARRNNSNLRYAALPKESVCTENLTPWKKLLPCDSNAGLSQLLNAIPVFSANFFSLALDFRPVCGNTDCTKIFVELKQTVSVVFDPIVKQHGKQDWSLMKTFGTYVTKMCPVAEKSLLFIDVTSNTTSNPFTISPTPTEIIEKQNHGETQKWALFNIAIHLAEKNSLNVKSIYKKEHIYWITKSPPIHAIRYNTGYGLERGGIECNIHNQMSRKVKIIYLEVIPWFLRIYVHTLKILSNGVLLKPVSQYYKPAKDREQPHHLELVLELKPSSVTKISFDYELAFLKWTEYPPDANHGFYIDSSVITAEIDNGLNYTHIPRSVTGIYKSIEKSDEPLLLHIYTNTLLVTLPTPDFSMPYNVICLTCTVVALAFGPIHNITTKRLQPVETNKIGLFGKIKLKVKKLFAKEDKLIEKKTQ